MTRKRRRIFISDPVGTRAPLHRALRQVFVCYGCERPQPLNTLYVAGTTMSGQRVKTCTECWLKNLGRAR